jgi:3-oxoacid CoA-transferase B subunit
MIEDKTEAKKIIAKRISKIFEDGDVVNLGIGVPMLVPKYIPDDVHITLQSENGLTAMGPPPEKEEDIDEAITNAGGEPVTILEHGAFFDSATSFGLIRGGHLDYTVLGTLQVDAEGNIANWQIPGKLMVGMGGAMDLVTGAKKVIVATMHSNRGRPKILEKCELPLTGVRCVDFIVTELGLFEVTKSGLILKEIQKNATLKEIKDKTDAEFRVASDLETMDDI